MIDPLRNATSDPKRATILIVDDQPVNIQVAYKLLREDYHIQVATSGMKVLELARSATPPSLILLDIQMPDMDGYEVCRRLQADERTRDIPVIFLTAKDTDADEEKGLNLGAVDYFTKPLRSAIVRARIRNHINLKIKTDRLEQLSMLDGLTDIPNRRFFDDYFARAWGDTRRQSEPLSVIMLDIDHFKAYNDHYGHGAGDECLRRVTRALAGQVGRPTDLVARYGGEEFVAVLPRTDVAGALKTARGFCVAVEALAIPHAYSDAAAVVTVSVGAATHGEAYEASASPALLRAADSALYLAKKRGRNRVEQFDPDSTEVPPEESGEKRNNA